MTDVATEASDTPSGPTPGPTPEVPAPSPETTPAEAPAAPAEAPAEPAPSPAPASAGEPAPTPPPAPADEPEAKTNRRGRGELEADVKVICDQFVTGAIALGEGEFLTAHKIANRVKELRALEDPPSSGAVTAVLERWAEVGYATLNEKPKAFSDYTDAGRTEGLTALKAKRAEEKRSERAATKLANKAAAAAAAPAPETAPEAAPSSDQEPNTIGESSEPAGATAPEPEPVAVAVADSAAVTAAEETAADVPF